MKLFTGIITVLLSTSLLAQFAPPAGFPGSTAIDKDSSIIVNWASEVIAFERGFADIASSGDGLAAFGDSSEAIGVADGSPTAVVSLGDQGSITLTFPFPIRNGEGFDFAVFENSFSDSYLELAHVEVSSDGSRFVRIPSISNTPVDSQTGTFADTDATLIHNLAGKYRGGFGTPFDLEDIIDSTEIDLNQINYVRIIDVVGSIDPAFGTQDSEGNLINDPYPTSFESGGFDLDGVAVINESNPAGLFENSLSKVQVYPNPSKGMVFIDTESLIEEMQLFDLSGNQLLAIKNSNTLNLKDYQLSEGLYLLMIRDEFGSVFQERLIYSK